MDTFDIFLGVFLAFLASLFVTTALLAGGPEQEDINAACEDRGGVIAYQDHSWGATNGVGTAICADKVAVEVED